MWRPCLSNRSTAFRETQPWTNIVCNAHADANFLQKSFTTEEHTTTSLTTPRDNIITSAGDPFSVIEDLLPTIPMDAIPRLDEIAPAPEGVRFIDFGIKRLSDFRAFFSLLFKSLPYQAKLLIHSGHGNVSILLSDIPLDRAAFAITARATIRRINGAPCMGRHRLFSRTTYPQCGLVTRSEESLKHHCVRCPNGGMRHMMRAGLVGVLRSILRDVDIPDMAVVT